MTYIFTELIRETNLNTQKFHYTNEIANSFICFLSLQGDLAKKLNYSVQRILTKENELETDSDGEKTSGAKHNLLSLASGAFGENVKCCLVQAKAFVYVKMF